MFSRNISSGLIKKYSKKQDESKKRIKSGFFDYKAHYADER